jgi:hypothetical protein
MVHCGVLVCLSSTAEIKKRLEQNWIQFLKKNYTALTADRVDGASPPSVFIGSYGYPKVRVGPMIPPLHGNTEILDRPELWAGKSIEEIANYRLSLVRGVSMLRIDEINDRFVAKLQDLAMSRRPVESEAVFEKRPLGDIDLENEVRLNPESAPFGPAAPLKHFKLTAASSADRRIESAFCDIDLQASDAMVTLYKKGVETSRINRALSIGMLGVRNRRRLVPTRWSISAADDVISKELVEEIEPNPSIDNCQVTEYTHVANRYVVVLVPDDVWSFEVIESWFSANGRVGFGNDFEDARGLDHYPSIAGAYFAARLAVAEYLHNSRRKASALVLREIHPEYVMPLGVWQIREGVRQALKTAPSIFDNFPAAFSFACSRLSVSSAELIGISRFWKNRREQRRITDFT